MEVFSPDDASKNGIREFENRKIGKRYLFYKTLPHQSTCIRKALFEEYGLYDTSFVIAADHDFFVRVFNKGSKINFAPLCISRYMLDGLSAQLKRSKLFDDERNRIRKNHFSIGYRRIRGKMVIQELMYLTARLIRMGNRLRLRFECHCPAKPAFTGVYGMLLVGN